MSKNRGKETELIDIGKKLQKSQSKDALVKQLLVRAWSPEKKRSNLIVFEARNNCGRSLLGALRSSRSDENGPVLSR